MGDVIKLRNARKKITRDRDQQKAAANRLIHGRSLAQRRREQTEDEKARKHLDHHRIETGDEQ